MAINRTVRALEKQATWNQGITPWNISGAELRRKLRELLGFNELLERMQQDWEWTASALHPYAERARSLTDKIQAILHFTIRGSMSDTQIVHQLLSQLGLKFEFRWSRSIAGHEGTKLKVFHLVAEVWKRLWNVLERRHGRRPVQEESGIGSPLASNDLNVECDPTPSSPPDLEAWFTPESLADVQQMWKLADGGMRADLTRGVPQAVLRHLDVAG